MTTGHTAIDCPICGREAPTVAHGVVAPFISALSRLPLGQQTTLRRCDGCDLSFFDFRYGDEELSALYGHYRGDVYRTTRHRWEPWYSRRVNDVCSTDADLASERRLFMTKVLDAAQMNARLNCVVDFGGDEGQLFPPVPTGHQENLCDVSNRELPAGIEAAFQH